jgi:hypothetical protein
MASEASLIVKDQIRSHKPNMAKKTAKKIDNKTM